MIVREVPKGCPQPGCGHAAASSGTARWQAGHVFIAGTPLTDRDILAAHNIVRRARASKGTETGRELSRTHTDFIDPAQFARLLTRRLYKTSASFRESDKPPLL